LTGGDTVLLADDDAAAGLVYVGFWARVGACLIDTVLLLVVTAPLSWLVYGQMASGGQMFQGPVDILINGVLPAALVLWLWHKLQATPGKLALSAKIVDADTGEVPSLRQLVIRYVGYFVSAIPLCIGFVWVAFDSRKQGWHDKMANTVVVRPAGPLKARFNAPKA
jgi:uncharacterized RDD family membrane protein YckC